MARIITLRVFLVQKISRMVYAVSAVIETNMRIYWGMRKAERCSAVPVPLYTCVKKTWVVAVGRQEKNMQTNRRTLSSSAINPVFTNTFSQISTPSTGVMISFPTANEMIAPFGKVLHCFVGIFNLAKAEPRHMSPSGTEAPPMNVVVSMMNARGG